MEQIPDHPMIRSLERTGEPTWAQIRRIPVGATRRTDCHANAAALARNDRGEGRVARKSDVSL